MRLQGRNQTMWKVPERWRSQWEQMLVVFLHLEDIKIDSATNICEGWSFYHAHFGTACHVGNVVF
jgi:hypothetical protein